MIEARIAPDPEAIAACYQHAPHWEGLLLGPVPFGSPPDHRTVLHIQVLFSADLESATDDAFGYAQNMCASLHHPYDADEWDLMALRLVNAN